MNGELQSNKSFDDFSSSGDDICRDFLRNVCRRGSKCKFRHPYNNDIEIPEKNYFSINNQPAEIHFCHDFQNTGSCRRSTCRFIHCSREEEDYYKQSGRLPDDIGPSVKKYPGGNLPPICKDFLKGECYRGNRCKYRHVNTGDYDSDTPYKYQKFQNGYDDSYRNTKRRRMDNYDSEQHGNLAEENRLLHSRIAELTKQVNDLNAINELLLEQNARFRSAQASLANGAKAAHQSVVQTCMQTLVTPTSVLTQPISGSQMLTTVSPALLHAAQSSMVQTAASQNVAPLSHPVVLPRQSLDAGTPSAVAAPSPLACSVTLSTPLLSYPIMSHSVPNSNLV